MSILDLIVKNLLGIFVLLHFWSKNADGSQGIMGNLIWGKRSNDTYLQFHPLSILNCVRECQVRKRCVSINYSDVMKFCELNHKLLSGPEVFDFDEETGNFIYSAIDSWPQALAPNCVDVSCSENEACDYRDGGCRISDCGAVNFTIPDNAELKYFGSHEVGNGVEFKCTDGHVMFSKQSGEKLFYGYVMCGVTGQWGDVNFVCKGCAFKNLYIDENSEVINSFRKDLRYELRCKAGYQAYNVNGELINGNIVIRCEGDGNWRGTDFFCKRAKTLVRDFCPRSYVFDETNMLCYKYDARILVQSEASAECNKDNAHLLSIDRPLTVDFVRRISGGHAIFVDGFWNSTEWIGWTNEILWYIKSKNMPGTENERCIAFIGGALKAISCTTALRFICQLEICPESAGYTYKLDDQQELCYKIMPASNCNNRVCSICNQIGQSCTESPYDPQFLVKDSTNDFLIEDILHNEKLLTNHKAYMLYTEEESYKKSKYRCRENEMMLAHLDNEEKRHIAAAFMRQDGEPAWIGLQLDVRETYNYTTVDGQPFNTHQRNVFIEYTDDQKCMVVQMKNRILKSMNCSVENLYICTYIFKSTLKKPFDEAYKDCKDRDKQLIQILSESSVNAAKEYLQDDLKSWFFVDLKLQNKNYMYKWNKGNIEERFEFGQIYSNDTKDLCRGVLFNATSITFMLSMFEEAHPTLCETRRGVMWYGATSNVTNTMDKTLKVKPMPCNNMLPYVCEIKTNNVIQKLKLFKKKQVVP